MDQLSILQMIVTAQRSHEQNQATKTSKRNLADICSLSENMKINAAFSTAQSTH